MQRLSIHEPEFVHGQLLHFQDWTVLVVSSIKSQWNCVLFTISMKITCCSKFCWNFCLWCSPWNHVVECANFKTACIFISNFYVSMKSLFSVMEPLAGVLRVCDTTTPWNAPPVCQPARDAVWHTVAGPCQSVCMVTAGTWIAVQHLCTYGSLCIKCSCTLMKKLMKCSASCSCFSECSCIKSY
jgi:hypothetical protein